jgi:hypothetical protein
MSHFINGLYYFSRFRICKVLGKVALIEVEAVSDLESAKTHLKNIAASCPGEYVIFSNKTGKVVAKAQYRI